MKCPNCGSPIKRGDMFCGHCGAKRKKKSKKGLLLLIGFLVVIFGLAGIAYKLLMPGTSQEGTVEDGFVCLSEGFTDIKIVDETSALAAVEDVAKTLGIGNVNEEFSNCREDTVSGNTYYRFYQEYKGLPVYGKSLVVVADEDGNGLQIAGKYELIDNIDIVPSISQNDIDASIKSFIEQKLSLPVLDIEIEPITDDALCIYSENPGASYLAYNLTVSGTFAQIYKFIVDAQNGEILQARSIVDVVKAAEGYKASDTDHKNGFEVVFTDDDYLLFDSSRNFAVLWLHGEQIIGTITDSWGTPILSENGEKYEFFQRNQGRFVRSQNNIFGDTQAEIDAKFEDGAQFLINMSAISDTYKKMGFNLDRRLYLFYDDGYDNGTNALAIMDVDNWDYGMISVGSKMEMNQIDVLAHEFTHIVSKLIVHWTEDAPGIGEGISDVLGELIEATIMNREPDWENGYRDMKSPRKTGNLTYYSELSDDTEEHTASTLISHAAYLMYTGIDGNPNFTALSTEDLAHLFYEALFTLPSDCTFSQFRTLVQNTANVMYKQGRLTYAQTRCVSNAFFQVGIDSTITPVQKQLTIDVYGIGDRPYADYTLYVWRGGAVKTYDGATVSAEGVSFPLTGEYELCFVDNANDKNRTNVKVKVLERGGTETLPVFTQCGTAKIEGPILDLFFPSPDYSLYVPVIEKAIAERPHSGDDYGILYDLDKDGVEELFMLHTYSGGAIPEMGYSIYDINDGALVTRAEKQTLIVMAGGGGCMAGISETDGGTYFYAYSLQIGDVYANSIITVYDQSFSVYKTFEANMETEGTHITEDPYATSYSIDGSSCTEAEYKLLLSTILPFDTACFQLENTGRQIGRFFNGQWYGETLTALLNRLKASAEPDVDETVNGEDAYREVLDMFYRNIQNGWTELDQEGWDDPCDPDSVSYLLYSNGTLSSIGALSLSEIGYCIRDIDGNGIPELMVTRKWFSEKYPGIISDLYTLSGGHPIHLASGGDRAWYYLAENDSICFEGSSDAFSNVQCDYSIDAKAGKLKVTQAVIYDAFTNSTAPWYYSETEYYDPQAYDFIYDALTGISEEEAQRIIASFPQHKAYPLTTFDQYQPGGQRVEIDKADENGSLNIPVLEGTWANEFSEDAFALFYLTEFSSDGTVVQHGYRNIDKGRFQITGANTVVATFDDNYWDSPGVGLQKIADYSYTVTYTYDKSSDTLFADYSTEFENAVNSNANDGTLSRWHDGHDTVTGKDTAPKKLSESDAQRIAEWYWQDSLETPSEIWADIAAKAHGTKTYQGKEFYYCTLTGQVDGHRTTLDYLYIDAETGDCYFGIDHPEELIYEGSAII